MWLYGAGHIVKDHSGSERETFFRSAARALLYASSYSQEHWLEREIAQWVHHEGSIQ